MKEYLNGYFKGIYLIGIITICIDTKIKILPSAIILLYYTYKIFITFHLQQLFNYSQ